MKFILLTFLLFFIYSNNYAQYWTIQRSGIPNGHNARGFFVDENTGWVTGEFGRILNTTNGGNNWMNQPYGANLYMFDAYFVNSNTG
ncbi:MAG: hypothetical protein ABI543_08210 [Ignavibacteria bacterium]